MSNPCITLGARIFPATIIKLSSSTSPHMNHAVTGSPTSARLSLPNSLASLKCDSLPTVKNQHALWQRLLVCLPHTCSEFEMSRQTLSQNSNTSRHAKQHRKHQQQNQSLMKQDWGYDDHAWVSTLNPMHISLWTPEVPSVPLLAHSVV